MEETLCGVYPVVTPDPEAAGELRLNREGAYYRLRYNGPLLSKPMRLWALGRERWLKLGVPCPDGGSATLNRRLSADVLRPLGGIISLVRLFPPDCTPEAPAHPAKNAPSPSGPKAWRPDGWAPLPEGERSEIPGSAEVYIRLFQGHRLAALPLNHESPFPFPEILRYGTPRSIDGRVLLVYEIRHGRLCPLQSF